jgi:hypothetical protein
MFSMSGMIERTINLEATQTYADLKAALLKGGCRIIQEEPSTLIIAKQGSLWGISPKAAKKNIQVNIEPEGSHSKVKCSSKLSADWKNVTLVGCIFALLLIIICVWIAIDLNSYAATLNPSFWSWIVSNQGIPNLQVSRAFTLLTGLLAVFLSVVVVIEAVITIRVNTKIDDFTKETLNSLVA